MKTVILAGGLGSRLSEETDIRPKPMVEIGGRPILWHIMKSYSRHGFNDFIICLGYRGYVIKEYFANYFLHMADVTFDLGENSMRVHHRKAEPWRVTLVDTGADTMTGGRIKRVAPYIGEESFMLTYGDGVSDVDIGALVTFHRRHGRLATMTTVQPQGRYGVIELEGDRISSFREKPRSSEEWINAGFFVLQPEIFGLIDGDETIFEQEPLNTLTGRGELIANRHYGFWKCMDTLRDKVALNQLWQNGSAPWKVWDD